MKRKLALLFLLAALCFGQTQGIPLAQSTLLYGVAGTASAVSYTIFGAQISAGVVGLPVLLGQGTLPVASGVLTVGTPSIVTSIILTNNTGSAVSGVVIYFAGISAANQFLPSTTIPANGGLRLNGLTGQYYTYDATGNVLQTATAAFDSTIASPTTPLALGTAGTATTAAHRDHTHQSPGGCSSIVAGAAIANTETVVSSCSVPATMMQAGTTFRVRAAGVGTTTSATAGTFRVRVGPTTLAGNVCTSVAATTVTTVTAQPFAFEAICTVRTAGASGTLIGEAKAHSSNVSTGLFDALNNLSTTTATVAVDTTVANLVEFTYVSGASTVTLTFHNAYVSIDRM